MPNPYRIIDLTQFSGNPTGNEIMELSQGGNGSFQIAIATLVYGRAQVTIATAGTYNLSATTYGDILVTTTGAVTVNLPDSTVRGGAPTTIVAQQTTTPNITIAPAGGQTVLGNASLTITNSYGAYTLWPVLASPGGWYEH